MYNLTKITIESLKNVDLYNIENLTFGYTFNEII